MDVRNAFKCISKSVTGRQDLILNVFLTSCKKLLHLVFYLFFEEGKHTQSNDKNFLQPGNKLQRELSEVSPPTRSW